MATIDPQKLKEIAILASIKKLRQDLENLPKDFKGDKGDKPIAGVDYPIPKDGYTPRKGIDYFDGKDGIGIDGKDGKDADLFKTAKLASKLTSEELKPLIPTIPQIKKELPLSGEKTRDLLEELQGEDRLDKSAVKGIEDLEKKLNENKNGGVRVIGGRAGVQLYIDGSKQGLVQTINLIAGNGVTLTYSRNFGRNDVTISNDSVEGTVLEATGTVDSSNKDFTFTAKPSLIVIDGTPYRETNKIGETIWSWSDPTATLTLAPQSDVYGLR